MAVSILSDKLWRRIEPLLPKPKKKRNIQHAGRKPTDPRKVITGILFALQLLEVFYRKRVNFHRKYKKILQEL